MYTLHLDLHLKFVPPMSKHGLGIVLTRAVQLPFVPASSLRIAGASLDEHGGPSGFGLEELTWDVDREVFSASTQIICHDEPLALIPDAIRSWLEMGWELGSYADTCEQPHDGDDTIEMEDDGEYERLEGTCETSSRSCTSFEGSKFTHRSASRSEIRCEFAARSRLSPPILTPATHREVSFTIQTISIA